MQDLTKLTVFEVFEKVKARKITFDQFNEWVKARELECFWEGYER